MGRSSGIRKNVLLATRVTPKISQTVRQLAYREGLTVSEWIRNLIVAELKKSNMLPNRLMSPTKDNQSSQF
jgi:hypothetical protein